jgi:hypothetical protein
VLVLNLSLMLLRQVDGLDDAQTASVLLAHVVQLRSLWKFENAQSAALREVRFRARARLAARASLACMDVSCYFSAQA